MSNPTKISVLTSFLLCFALIKSASAQETLSTLFIPGFDPQPISAIPLGVDAQGRTTYEIKQGSLTGTFEEDTFPETATLVAGGNEAILSANGFSVSCSIDGAVANCVGGDGTETETYTEDAAPITVQVDPAVTPTTTAGGAPPNGDESTSTSGGPPSPTDSNSNNNAATRIAGTGQMALGLGWILSVSLILVAMPA